MNYKRNKAGGVERPYTFMEFKEIIEDLCREQKVPCIDSLDYFSAKGSWMSSIQPQLFVDDYDIDVVSETTFGSCEGIYSHFYIWMHGEKIDFAVAKNLSRTDESFLDMSIFAAKFCLLARKYTWEHEQEFNWSGYDVGYEDENGKFVARVICGKLESAKSHAKEYKKQGHKAVIVDNSTKKRQTIS